MLWKKLKLLIWKNFLLQKRHKWQTIFEIASPVIFALFLILLRSIVDPKSKPDMEYAPFLPTYFNMSGRKLGNLTTARKAGTLAFSPDGDLARKVTKEAMAIVARDNLQGWLAILFDMKYLPEPKGYNTAKEMETALNKPGVMDYILVGIQYDNIQPNATSFPKDVMVTFRFPAVMRTPMLEHPIRASWRTNLRLPLFPRPGPRDPDDMYGGNTPGYSVEMFLAVQHAVSQAIIKEISGKKVETKVYLQRFPQPAYIEDLLLVAMERFVSMILMLCFAYTFVNTVRVVTFEKELQLKETMTIMGLPSSLHWLAWFIKQFTYLLISVILLIILFKVPIKWAANGERFAVLTYTPPTVLFFFLILFVISSLSFCFMVSVFFSRANTAASFMGLAWFATYSVYMLTQVLYEDITFSTKLGLSFISNTALGYAFQMLVVAEGNKGLKWSQMWLPVSYHDDFTPGHVALMLIADSVIYMLIAMYVEKIRPGLYGVPLKWYFPLTKQFWMPNKKKISPMSTDSSGAEYKDSLLKIVHDEEPVGMPIGVNIQNLTKIYKGRKKAVDNLNLRVYENEITVLLGHNGAGKTTTISMLTGTIPPTTGSAIINGYNIVTETESARKSLGICPQHNVLFPDLTVAEHIIFYARLKGLEEHKIDAEVKHFVKLLDLEEKANVLSSMLSGGQKRRLSVGAAMCGGSRVVLLDEPTSGLDPAARRRLWDLLQKEKSGRTMILTTHFMDEADVLGDRIAIMAGGRLQCVGTPYFLKKHYGLGYKLTIVKGDNCNVEDILKLLHKYFTDVRENTNIGSELTYILPRDDASKFPDMLKELEDTSQSLGVSSYGLSITTLEEVFMKAGAEVMEDKMQYHNAMAFNKVNGNGVVQSHRSDEEYGGELTDMHPVTGVKLLKNHIRAMFLKLFYNSIRNKLSNAIQFLSPIVNIVISVVISKSWKFMSELPPLRLSLESGFKNTETLVSTKNLTNDTVDDSIFASFKEIFRNSSYPGLSLNDIADKDIGKHYLKLISSDLARVRMETLIGATFSDKSITGWFSNYGYHDSAIVLATIDDAIMRAMSPGNTLTVVNHPLPYAIENLVRVMASGSSMGFQFAFNIGFCLAFVSSFLVLFVIKERLCGAKLLQRISGVRPIVLWGCAYVWDWIWLFLIHLCIIITLAIFQESSLSTPAELGRVLLVLAVFSFAMIPLHYLASFYFEAAATGFAKMCFINIFAGTMPFLITEVLRLPEVGSPYYARLFDAIFSPLPLYCLSRCFRDMTVSSFSMMACDGLCERFQIINCTRKTICDSFNITVCCIDDNPFLKWSEPGIGRYLFIMTMVGVVSFALLLIKEYKIINKLIYRNTKNQPLPIDSLEDSDVAYERNMMQSLTRHELPNHSLVCKDLTKYYKNFLAVNRLTFGVKKSECFGLLGINGAGKTSTFRMLTGDTKISYGDAYIHGLSIKTQVQLVHRLIGYCPQFDALLDNLTARETLRIYCLLRGIPEKQGRAWSMEIAKELGFQMHFNKKVQACSGGTKRKISTAVALLGDSPLVFLDEPTTGMDPASKRLVWASITKAVRSGRSVVLTSHSMEECEALCSRLTVMVRGKLYCLGPLQHLKNKFSQGYTLNVKCKLGPRRDQDSEDINLYLLDQFPGAKLIEKYMGISTYYLDDKELPWWRVFRVMETAVDLLPIEDYSVSQTTLEQVFLRFTRLYGHID